MEKPPVGCSRVACMHSAFGLYLPFLFNCLTLFLSPFFCAVRDTQHLLRNSQSVRVRLYVRPSQRMQRVKLAVTLRTDFLPPSSPLFRLFFFFSLLGDLYKRLAGSSYAQVVSLLRKTQLALLNHYVAFISLSRLQQTQQKRTGS
jgi:hypothetical protein